MMAQGKSSPILIAIVGLALAGLVGLNIAQQRNTPKTEAQLQAEAEAEQAKLAKGATPAPKAGDVPKEVAEMDPALATPDATFGKADAKHTVTFGFSWTPEFQANPKGLAELAAGVIKAAPDTKIRLVNVDLVDSVPAGISVDNVKVMEPSQGGTFDVSQMGNVMPHLVAK